MPVDTCTMQPHPQWKESKSMTQIKNLCNKNKNLPIKKPKSSLLRLNTNFYGKSNDPCNMSQKMVLEINQEYLLEILIKGCYNLCRNLRYCSSAA
jgi:hypothetical protein